MIENMEQLVEVMTRAAFDERRKGKGIKDEMHAALLAAQAEGAEMVPSISTDSMDWKGAKLKGVIAANRMMKPSSRETYAAMLTANPLRIKE